MGRRRRRREERAARRSQREKLFDIARKVYEDGDDADDLREKIQDELGRQNLGAEDLSGFLKLLEIILPLLLRLFGGF